MQPVCPELMDTTLTSWPVRKHCSFSHPSPWAGRWAHNSRLRSNHPGHNCPPWLSQPGQRRYLCCLQACNKLLTSHHLPTVLPFPGTCPPQYSQPTRAERAARSRLVVRNSSEEEFGLFCKHYKQFPWQLCPRTCLLAVKTSRCTSCPLSSRCLTQSCPAL